MEGQLVITLKDGHLQVQGPIEDPLLCYALLEAARDVVHARVAKAQVEVTPASGIVVPSIPTLPAPGSPFGARRKP